MINRFKNIGLREPIVLHSIDLNWQRVDFYTTFVEGVKLNSLLNLQLFELVEG